jgi:hypothetical protein
VERVEITVGQALRHRHQRVGALAPGLHGIVGVQAQDVQQLLLELGQRGVLVEVGMDERGPRRRRAGQDRPVELAAGDIPAYYTASDPRPNRVPS